MPNYDKLHVPQSLVYCKNPKQAKLILQQILDKAKQNNISQAQNEFDYLILNIDGLGRCADYWVFVVRFWVITRNLQMAVRNMQEAFNCQAQPSNILFQTQQSLQELQKKVEQQTKTSPHVMQQLSSIKDSFIENSATFLSKPAQSKKMADVDYSKYKQELIAIQQKTSLSTVESVGQIPLQLSQLSK